MKNKVKQTIAIIGAGVAGSVCANILKDGGYNPIVIEKSKRVGGRLATRRTELGLGFDHGAQFFTFHSERFQVLRDKSLSIKAIGSWHPKLIGDSAGQNTDWFVGQPDMNALVKPLMKNIQVNFASEASSVVREGKKWRIRTLTDEIGTLFENVIFTVPAPQIKYLLPFENELVNEISEVEIAPCWTLLLAFERSLNLDFEVWKSDVGDITWVALNSSKPFRTKNEECWVVHAGPEWSKNNLERDNEQIINGLQGELRTIFGESFSNAFFAASHRWRYARTMRPLMKPYLCKTDKSLFIGGDWCLGSRVENAYESGFMIAKSFIEKFK
jgi:predicted NAD/FAD-dependent oxidoreductase